MAAVATAQPDAQKVFRAIAMIMNRREDAAKVVLKSVRKKGAEDRKKVS